MNTLSPAPDGIFNVLKEPGVTSHGVVARLRRILGLRQIGHGGTLDPGAAGVLPVLVGRATKLMPYLIEHPKTYRAEMTLGVATDTQDVSGKTLRVETDFRVSPAALGEAIGSFLGEIEQVPPMTSALRQNGKRLYELAHKGEVVDRPTRRVRIMDAHVLAVWPTETEVLVSGTRVLFEVVCSKGTYIRTLCHDIGECLGCGAHMSFLVRTAVGPFSLDTSYALEEIDELSKGGKLASAIRPLQDALAHLPQFNVNDDEALALSHGKRCDVDVRRLPTDLKSGAMVAVTQVEGGLVCIARLVEEGKARRLQPVRVFR